MMRVTGIIPGMGWVYMLQSSVGSSESLYPVSILTHVPPSRCKAYCRLPSDDVNTAAVGPKCIVTIASLAPIALWYLRMAQAIGPTQWVNRLASPTRMVFGVDGLGSLVALVALVALIGGLDLGTWSTVGHRATDSTSSWVANSFEAGGKFVRLPCVQNGLATAGNYAALAVAQASKYQPVRQVGNEFVYRAIWHGR